MIVVSSIIRMKRRLAQILERKEALAGDELFMILMMQMFNRAGGYVVNFMKLAFFRYGETLVVGLQTCHRYANSDRSINFPKIGLFFLIYGLMGCE
jgi:hypothetical protein